MFDPVSKRSVVKTTGKDTRMSVVIFSILLSVILLGSLWFHDTWYPPEGRAERKRWNRSKGGNTPINQAETLLQPAPVGKAAESTFPLSR